MGSVAEGIGERIWSVRVQGGNPCSIRLPFGVVQDHEGGLSVWKIRGTQAQVQGVLNVLIENGCKVAMYEDGQTAEQEQIRLNMLGVQREGFVFRSERCPTCALFDPQTDNNCGADDWEASLLDALLQKDKARADLESCPLRLSAG